MNIKSAVEDDSHHDRLTTRAKQTAHNMLQPHVCSELERTAEVFRERTFSFGSQIRKERSMLTSKELATAHAQNMEKIHVR